MAHWVPREQVRVTLYGGTFTVDKVIEMAYPQTEQAQRAKQLIEEANIPFVTLVGIRLDYNPALRAPESVMHIILAEMPNPDRVYDIIGRIYVALCHDETVGLVPRLDV